jgi:hypothetical protein
MSTQLSQEALLLMNFCEAHAEARSVGVVHSVNLQRRRTDLELQAKNVSRTPSHTEQQSLFLSRVWAKVRLIYRDAGQFEAAEEAGIESLANAPWFALKSAKFTWLKRLLLQPINSLLVLVGIYLVVCLLLTIAYCWGQPHWHVDLTSDGLFSFLFLFVRVFVSVTRTEHVEGVEMKRELWAYQATEAAAAVCSLIFIGILVSALFRKLTQG